jgi:hypothetical protein
MSFASISNEIFPYLARLEVPLSGGNEEGGATWVLLVFSDTADAWWCFEGRKERWRRDDWTDLRVASSRKSPVLSNREQVGDFEHQDV